MELVQALLLGLVLVSVIRRYSNPKKYRKDRH
jgi:hypothetical protein